MKTNMIQNRKKKYLKFRFPLILEMNWKVKSFKFCKFNHLYICIWQKKKELSFFGHVFFKGRSFRVYFFFSFTSQKMGQNGLWSFWKSTKDFSRGKTSLDYTNSNFLLRGEIFFAMRPKSKYVFRLSHL